MKPSIPKGTRDFTPQEVNKRNYIVSTIKNAFVKYAYQPIETPAMELLTTLTGKYGEEGDQLLFKILKNGNFLEKVTDLDNHKKLAFQIAEKGLRYDLTVPFARFVVMNQNEISFPFKRYQIQPVWRGDKPQKGRYQEFWQCDADVVGSDSLLYEAELLRMMDEVFSSLGFPVVLKVNNRKILNGLAEVCGIPDKMMSMTIALDKLDKIGVEGVRKEMLANGIDENAVSKIENIIADASFQNIKVKLADSEIGSKGIAELEEVFQLNSRKPLKNELEFDLTLARGLSYYTGAIFEVKAKNVTMGSITGGGRYDDLTGLFGLKGVSGVGISFGLDRIYDVMNELNLFPDDINNVIKVLFVTFDKASFDYAYDCVAELRSHGIASDLYPKPVKLQKQMEYANKRKVPFVAIIGDSEVQNGTVSLKNMMTGEQKTVSLDELCKLA